MARMIKVWEKNTHERIVHMESFRYLETFTVFCLELEDMNTTPEDKYHYHYEAYIKMDNYGIRYFYGEPKVQTPYYEDPYITQFDDFVANVLVGLFWEADLYVDENCDPEDIEDWCCMKYMIENMEPEFDYDRLDLLEDSLQF